MGKSKVQAEFRPAIEDAIDCLANIFSEYIDGIYLYGSVGRGDARIHASDLDLTLIFKMPLSAVNRQAFANLKDGLQERHPELLKVDFDIGSVSDVFKEKNKYSWGYWIKHCCKCIWGRDLSEQLPLLKPSRAITLAINGDFKEVIEDIEEYIEKLGSETQAKEIQRLKREASRKLVRSTSIVLTDNPDFWPITLEDHFEVFCSDFPHK